jgi:hypothetical protein
MPSVPWSRRLLTIACTGAVLVGACNTAKPKSVLQDLDTTPFAAEKPFNKNNVIDSAAFTDIETIDRTTIQKFFHRTPYEDRSSFLETYQSNGVRAADAVANVAHEYRINPIVFLVFAEEMQGLLGEKTYPFPVDRVEYFLRCGCLQQTSCLPTLAGFDRQIDCLGRSLREAIDKARDKKETPGGWAIGKAMTTLDGDSVTPENEVTAALYERIPRVAEEGEGGTWLFWNIWQVFAKTLEYTGPVGAIDGRWIGEGCAVDEACGIQGGSCATDYPGGLCTVACTGKCPTQPSKSASFCAKFRDGGFCLQVCNPAAPACRPHYQCVRVAGFNDGETENVCSPDTSAPTSGATTLTAP